MVKKIVEFHCGTIAVDPDHTPGTRIAFTLPTNATAPTEDPAVPERALPPATAGTTDPTQDATP